MFDRYVAQTKPSWKRRALIIASVALHGAALIGLGVYGLLHIEEITPPALSLTFFSAPPPPPPPPPPKRRQTEHKVIPTEHKFVQPNPNAMIQPKPPEPEPEEEDNGVEGGVEGGVAGGVVGGTLGGQVGGTGKAPAPKMVASFTLAAQQLSHPEPHLPEWFTNQHPKQTIRGVYKVCLRTDGHIDSVTPMTSIPGVDQVVMDQIRTQWVYKSQPVPICTASALIFKIN